LSGFRQAEADGSHYRHDLHYSTKETVRVPVFKKENFGKEMAVDEKQIGEEMHTVISNRETGKIALLAGSMSCQEIARLLDKEDIACRDVETLTRDLSPLFSKVGNELFPNASHVADKFHIIRSLSDACQTVRVRLRQEVLRDKRINMTHTGSESGKGKRSV
jgi:transposase